MIRTLAKRTTLALAVAALLLQTTARPAAAAPGDVVADIITPEQHTMGPSIAFDGTYLYYTDQAGALLHRIDVPPASPTPQAPTGHIDIPIVGAPSGITSLSYDRVRDAFWAVGGDGMSVYLLSKTGSAQLVFVVNAATDRGFPQFHHFIWEVKIAYDGSDDSIWFTPDATTRIYHYHTYGSPTGDAVVVAATPFIDISAPPNDMNALCGYSESSGVAASATSIYVTAAGCGYYFEYSKTGTLIGSYAYGAYDDPGNGKPNQDIECDNLSYAVSVLWIKDAWNGRIRAFEQPAPNACTYGGGS